MRSSQEKQDTTLRSILLFVFGCALAAGLMYGAKRRRTGEHTVLLPLDMNVQPQALVQPPASVGQRASTAVPTAQVLPLLLVLIAQDAEDLVEQIVSLRGKSSESCDAKFPAPRKKLLAATLKGNKRSITRPYLDDVTAEGWKKTLDWDSVCFMVADLKYRFGHTNIWTMKDFSHDLDSSVIPWQIYSCTKCSTMFTV